MSAPRGNRVRASVARRSANPIVAVATPSKKGKQEPKRSKVEIIKEHSDFLRHPLIEQLATEARNGPLPHPHGGYHTPPKATFYALALRLRLWLSLPKPTTYSVLMARAHQSKPPPRAQCVLCM